MSAAEVIADLVIGGLDGLMRLRDSSDAREREAAEAAVARVRAAIAEIPVRTGPGGTWDADTARRVEEARRALAGGRSDAVTALHLGEVDLYEREMAAGGADLAEALAPALASARGRLELHLAPQGIGGVPLAERETEPPPEGEQ